MAALQPASLPHVERVHFASRPNLLVVPGPAQVEGFTPADEQFKCGANTTNPRGVGKIYEVPNEAAVTRADVWALQALLHDPADCPLQCRCSRVQGDLCFSFCHWQGELLHPLGQRLGSV